MCRPVSATSTASVRLPLKPTNAQAAVFLRAGGARRFAFNWALAQVKANQDRWAAEAIYDIPKGERTRPLSYFDLVRRWDATKRVAAPWHGGQSVWAFRYGIRAAYTAHTSFLKGQSRFPRFKARHRDRPRFTTAGWAATAARPDTGRQVWMGRPGRAVPRRAAPRPGSGGCWSAAGPGY